MKEALDVASKALPQDVPVGCVIFRYNGEKSENPYEQIASGFNTRERDCDPAGHAEINALKEAAEYLGRWRLDDCCIVVTLEPCPMCASAIVQARIPLVIYGAPDSTSGGVGERYLLNPQGGEPACKEVVGNVLEAECQALLKQFFKKQR